MTEEYLDDDIYECVPCMTLPSCGNCCGNVKIFRDRLREFDQLKNYIKQIIISEISNNVGDKDINFSLMFQALKVINEKETYNFDKPDFLNNHKK